MSQYTKEVREIIEKEFAWNVFGIYKYNSPKDFFLNSEVFKFEDTDEIWFIRLSKDHKGYLTFSLEYENLPSCTSNLDVKIIDHGDDELDMQDVWFSPSSAKTFFDYDIYTEMMEFKFKISYEISTTKTVTEDEISSENEDDDKMDWDSNDESSEKYYEWYGTFTSDVAKDAIIEDEDEDGPFYAIRTPNPDQPPNYLNALRDWQSDSPFSQTAPITEPEDFLDEDHIALNYHDSYLMGKMPSFFGKEYEKVAAELIEIERKDHLMRHTQSAINAIPDLLDIINVGTPDKWEYLQNMWVYYEKPQIPIEVLNVWETALSENVTLDNFFNMLKLANICKFRRLRDFIVVEFISKQKNEDLINSESWKQLTLEENRKMYKVIVHKLLKLKEMRKNVC